MTIHQILPSDSFHHILSFVAPKDLSACCQVSKAWYEWASQDPPWTEAAKKIPWATFAAKVFTRDPTQSMKQSLQKWGAHHLQSLEEICDRMDSFLKKLPRYRSGQFRCLTLGIDGQLREIRIAIQPKTYRCIFERTRRFAHLKCEETITFDRTKLYIFSHDLNQDTVRTRVFERPLANRHQTRKDSTCQIQTIESDYYEGKCIIPLLRDQQLQKKLKHIITKTLSAKISLCEWQHLRYAVVMAFGVGALFITLVASGACGTQVSDRQILKACLIATAVFSLFPISLMMIPNDK